jgi:hypothetical protein
MYRSLISLMPKTVPPLLDLFPNAAVAYSLRKLRTAYSGSAIRVRRSSDNTEQNIGFVGNNLDTASLLAFCGAGNGFVTTWYDQSGNNRNATQATAGNQPRIVNGGVIDSVGSLPAILTNSTLLDAIINIDTLSSSMFVVNKKNSGSLELNVSMGQDGIFNRYSAIRKSSSNDTNGIRFRDTSNNDAIFNTSNTSLDLTLNSFFTIAGNNRVIRTNGVEFSTNTDGFTFTANRLFINRVRNSSTQNIGNGYFSEIIIYANNKYNDRTGIESNINSHYNIY